MNVWRSWVFNVAFVGVTVVMSFAMLWVLFLPRRIVLRIIHLWLDQISWLEKHIMHLTYRVVGKEFLPNGPCIIAAKHQSAWETLKLHLLLGDPAIVLKKELLNIPIWGWYLGRSGMIPIDRSARSQALNGMLTAAHRAKDLGRKIVIFPQGTRLAPNAFRPYKSGVAALYQELNLPIVPMALNSGLYWPKRGFQKKSGMITVEFLQPLPPGLPREQMMAQLRDKLEAATDKLLAL